MKLNFSFFFEELAMGRSFWQVVRLFKRFQARWEYIDAAVPSETKQHVIAKLQSENYVYGGTFKLTYVSVFFP